MRPALVCLLAAATLATAGVAGTCGAARDVLDNGLVVITSPSETANLVAVEVLVKASALDEPPGKAGVRQLVQQTLVRGSRHMSGKELAATLDELGADFDAGLGLDYVETYVVCLNQDLGAAMELLAEVVRHPRFPAREVEAQRQVALRHLQYVRSDPFEIAQHLVRQGLYEGHPYAIAPQGTEESLAGLTRADLVDFHARCYVPNNTIISIAGGVSRAAGLAAVRRYFGDWQRGPLELPQAPAVRPLEHSTVHVRTAPIGQAYFMLGFTVGETTPDTYPVMEVVCALLGRGMGSRFFDALRERAAAAYEANAYYFALRRGGYLAAYVAAAPRDLEGTRRLIVAEFERLRSEAVSRGELNRAHQFAIGTHALAHEKTKDRAFHLAWYEAIGLGCDFDQHYAEAINSVTPEQVQAAARTHFGRYSLGLVLPGD